MLESLARLAGKTAAVGKNIASALVGNSKVPSKLSDVNTGGDSFSSPNDILGKIYDLMVRARQYQLLQRLDNEIAGRKEIDDENARNDAIIKALTVRRKKQKKEPPKPEVKEQPKPAPKEKTTPVKEQPQRPTVKPAPSKPTPTVSPPSAARIITGAAGATALLAGREALASNISKFESGSAGYNAYNKGTQGNKMIPSDVPIDFSKMTITDYLKRGDLPSGDPKRLFAVGRYQIIPKTMKSLVEKLKIDPDTTYLDAPTQDLLFTQGLTKALRKKVDEYITGKSDDRNGAILQLAQEFASIGIPYDMTVGNKQLRRGDSYYSGVGGNKAHNSPDAVGAALDADRFSYLSGKQKNVPVPSQSNLGSQIDSSSKENKDLKSAAQVKQPISVNTTNLAQTQTSKSQSGEEEYDDRSPYAKKR